ncbi:DUF6339 family protein [Halobacillus sp. A5]|uniref:DUF6339 family protein n=1 Tax=Halobacillus sp. A5 TaxID=2880263 RepID=UPI0020A6A5E3|nr:DUF6339 family protein [Halobacillus sp. A5]MCP3027018.1 hypothetical protein [Halobacillus sp. A5]
MWKKITTSEAEKIFFLFKEGEPPKHSCGGEYSGLRESLSKKYIEINNFIDENQVDKREYFIDLKFGLELFTLLKEQYNFTPRDASDDKVWLYFSMKVIPDIVYKRWGLKEERFYKQSRRIWLKTLWWFVYLSWNETKEDTYLILKDFSTDGIGQLVERSGFHGYRVDLTREIMKQFSELDTGGSKKDLFRKVLRLNTARVKSLEPSLTPGGTRSYVKRLLDYFHETYETTR